MSQNTDSTQEEPPITTPKSKTCQHCTTHKSLMKSLSDSLLSSEVAAHTMKRLCSKIPHEHYDKDGVLVQASGYIVPSPREAPEYMRKRWEHDLSKPTAAISDSIWVVGDFSSINAHTRLQDGKVPYEVIREDGSVHLLLPMNSSTWTVLASIIMSRGRHASTIHLSPEEMAERQRKSDTIVGSQRLTPNPIVY